MVYLSQDAKERARKAMVKKLSKEVKCRQDTGAERATASLVLEDYEAELISKGVSIGKDKLLTVLKYKAVPGVTIQMDKEALRTAYVNTLSLAERRRVRQAANPLSP